MAKKADGQGVFLGEIEQAGQGLLKQAIATAWKPSKSTEGNLVKYARAKLSDNMTMSITIVMKGTTSTDRKILKNLPAGDKVRKIAQIEAMLNELRSQ